MKFIKLSSVIISLFLFYSSLSYSDSFRVLPVSETSKQNSACPIPNREEKKLSCQVYRQTTNYTCGPAVAMTLMHYYGKLSNADMNRTNEMRIASEMGATEGYYGGTTLSEVADWLKSHGFNVNVGDRADTDMLIANINKGIPTILGYGQHWLIAKGYRKGKTPEEDEIIFADSCCNETSIQRKDLDIAWIQSQMPSNRCFKNLGFYITATPKH